ncbi:hypothetical protein IV454_09170 [Massilia antarctica]|uniref:Uncharacterized protein n=1 Tax=Massilia antarctica TaxID=2765360 RepID=A0AA49A9V0_9BURK|nr:hypothetical protein [Massilia antarctica]QPI51646.1 hypothetical protein IV454_09170 [Massilia antarctica]
MTPKSPNPYTAPKASFKDGVVTNRCWRDGKLLVASRREVLPPRCVKCNKPAVMDKPRSFSWHHPGWYVLIPVLVYIMASMFVRKRATLVIGLCEEHRRKRRNVSLAAYGLFGLGIVALFKAVNHVDPRLGWLASLLMGGAMLLAIAGQHTLRVASITQHEIRLKGCGPAFLDSLPNAQPAAPSRRPRSMP